MRSDWFVAGYGVGRTLVRRGQRDTGDRILSRCRSLFDSPYDLIALDFADHLKEQYGEAAADSYLAALRQVLLGQPELMPDVRDVGMRATNVEPFATGPSFEVEVGEGTHSLPSTWLSHGDQTTLAWLADMVGHLIWDHYATTDAPPTLLPKDMQGLVLIDELDLHLHPSWQVGLIPALKQTFPKLQFIVTTTHRCCSIETRRPATSPSTRTRARPS